MNDTHRHDVIVIGAGQAGLATSYYLRRQQLDYRVLDAETGPGGAWRHGWESLRLFSPARWSSLPGWIMPGGPDYYPTREEFVAYLGEYERRYAIPVERPLRVDALRDAGDGVHLRLVTSAGDWLARAVVAATGSWGAPVIPAIPGRESFGGEQLHSAEYASPLPFAGRRVLVVGGGNSGAQVFADLLDVADVSWVTRREPVLLRDEIDGRHLFEAATREYQARLAGQEVSAAEREPTLGDIVMVAPVRAARDRGLLASVRPFERFIRDGVIWPDGRAERIDAVIWCTGFRYALAPLRPLGVLDARGQVAVRGTRSVVEPRLWLVGYGEWTGYASATIIGVGRGARATAEEIASVAQRWTR